jgi:hypothetical protein
VTKDLARGRCFMPLCSYQAITRIGLSQHLVTVHNINGDEPDDDRTTWVDHAIERAFPAEP